LLLVTVVTSFCADYRKLAAYCKYPFDLTGAVVESIDDFAKTYDISKAFIGLVLIPIVGSVFLLQEEMPYNLVQ
jgi:hypothetical protein